MLENVAEGSEYIEVGGQRRHVLGYLQDFLFSPDRARTPVRALSGGERNRLLLARLFSRPANLLVLDEPTNDLDIETLELLEERLARVRRHDPPRLPRPRVPRPRRDLDARLRGRGPRGRVRRRLRGLGAASGAATARRAATASQARTASSAAAAVSAADAPPGRDPQPPAATAAPRPARAKRSFKEERELAELPARIEALEREQGELIEQQGRPEFYKQPPAEQARTRTRAAALATELEAAYARWEELEGRG